MKWHVYTLNEKNKPFYVGCTTKPKTRLESHKFKHRERDFVMIILATFTNKKEAIAFEDSLIKNNPDFLNKRTSSGYRTSKFEKKALEETQWKSMLTQSERKIISLLEAEIGDVQKELSELRTRRRKIANTAGVRSIRQRRDK